MKLAQMQVARRDFLHFLESWLGSKEAELVLDDTGVVRFEAEMQRVRSIELSDDGCEMEIFAYVANADAEHVRALFGEDGYPEDIQLLEPALKWRAESTRWTVDVVAEDGLVALSRRSPVSASPEEWQHAVAAFETEFAKWLAWLEK